MATYTPKQLFQTVATASFVTQYTVPASTSTIVKEIVVCNTTTSSATLSVSFVPNAGSAGTTNAVISAAPIAANSTVIYTFSQVLPTGAFISLLAGTASALTVTGSGIEAT